MPRITCSDNENGGNGWIMMDSKRNMASACNPQVFRGIRICREILHLIRLDWPFYPYDRRTTTGSRFFPGKCNRKRAGCKNEK